MFIDYIVQFINDVDVETAVIGSSNRKDIKCSRLTLYLEPTCFLQLFISIKKNNRKNYLRSYKIKYKPGFATTNNFNV